MIFLANIRQHPLRVGGGRGQKGGSPPSHHQPSKEITPLPLRGVLASLNLFISVVSLLIIPLHWVSCTPFPSALALGSQLRFASCGIFLFTQFFCWQAIRKNLSTEWYHLSGSSVTSMAMKHEVWASNSKHCLCLWSTLPETERRWDECFLVL